MTPTSNQETDFNKSLVSFYIMQTLYNLMFFLPTWVIFLQEKHGFSLTQVTLIDTAFWLTMALTEVPTGAVADTYGRKKSMLIGLAASGISVIVFGSASNFVLLMIANSVWGMAITFLSGADMAFFYDTLLNLGREKDYPRLRGRLTALTIIGTALGNFLGGILAAGNLSTPFWAYALVLGITFIVGLNLREPPRYVDNETNLPITYSKILRMAWESIRYQRSLQLSLLYSNFLPLTSVMITITFMQPHLREIGIPLAWMGVVIFCLSLPRFIGSAGAGKLTQLGGRWLWTAPVLAIGGLVGLATIPNLIGVGVFSLAIFASAASRPLIENLILNSAPQAARATILSADNLIFRFFLTLFEPAIGVLADIYDLNAAFLFLAASIGISLLVILLLWRPKIGLELAGEKV